MAVIWVTSPMLGSAFVSWVPLPNLLTEACVFMLGTPGKTRVHTTKEPLPALRIFVRIFSNRIWTCKCPPVPGHSAVPPGCSRPPRAFRILGLRSGPSRWGFVQLMHTSDLSAMHRLYTIGNFRQISFFYSSRKPLHQFTFLTPTSRVPFFFSPGDGATSGHGAFTSTL